MRPIVSVSKWGHAFKYNVNSNVHGAFEEPELCWLFNHNNKQENKTRNLNAIRSSGGAWKQFTDIYLQHLHSSVNTCSTDTSSGQIPTSS